MVINKMDNKNNSPHSLVAKYDDPDELLGQIIGDSFKDYRKRWLESSQGKIIPDYPIHLNFELTYGCNLRCEICVYALPTDERGYKVDKKAKISLEKYKEIIDEGSSKRLGAVSLNGYNEPLISKDIVEYIRYAKLKKIPDIFFVTNGLLMDEERAEELLESGLTRILFSIDAFTPETYKIIRKSNDYDKVVKNVLYFLKIKKQRGYTLPITRVSFVRNLVNINEQDEFINFWKDKVDYLLIQKFTNPFAGNSRYNEIEKKYRLEDAVPVVDCFQPSQRLSITNSGNVYPCCSGYGLKMIVGNIYKDTISNIWNNSCMENLRQNINADPSKQPENCRLCRS